MGCIDANEGHWKSEERTWLTVGYSNIFCTVHAVMLSKMI